MPVSSPVGIQREEAREYSRAFLMNQFLHNSKTFKNMKVVTAAVKHREGTEVYLATTAEEAVKQVVLQYVSENYEDWIEDDEVKDDIHRAIKAEKYGSAYMLYFDNHDSDWCDIEEGQQIYGL